MVNQFFENMFREDQHATIAEVLQVLQYFPESISEEDNLDLMEEVSEEELKATLESFYKDKSPGPDGWNIDFFLATYDTIGPDLLHMVEESRVNGHLHPPLNTTFLSLIPKKDNSDSLE